MIYLIPEKIDLDQLASSLPKKGRNDKDKIALLLHLVSEVPVYNRDALINGFTMLNAKLLQKIVRKYNYYLTHLIEHGILICDNYYISKSNAILEKDIKAKSKGYKFHPNINSYLISYTPSKWIGLNRNQPKEYESLFKWFNKNLTIDIKQANEELNSISKPNSFLSLRPIYFTIAQIQTNNYHFFNDNLSGRLHTSLTVLKRECRKCIKYDGKTLVEIDIVSSQPFFSLSLFNHILFNKEIKNILLIQSYMVGGWDDVIKYKELICTGTFYEYMLEQMKIEKPELQLERKDVKDMMFQTFFSDNRFLHQQEAWPKKLFKNLFPNVYQVFYDVKKKNKNALAIYLQKTEVELVLNRVVKRICEEQPELPLFTIHDSLVTTLGNDQYIAEILKEECLKMTGMMPMTKIEIWQ